MNCVRRVIIAFDLISSPCRWHLNFLQSSKRYKETAHVLMHSFADSTLLFPPIWNSSPLKCAGFPWLLWFLGFLKCFFRHVADGLWFQIAVFSCGHWHWSSVFLPFSYAGPPVFVPHRIDVHFIFATSVTFPSLYRIFFSYIIPAWTKLLVKNPVGQTLLRSIFTRCVTQPSVVCSKLNTAVELPPNLICVINWGNLASVSMAF